jgi:hypothetical protein
MTAGITIVEKLLAGQSFSRPLKPIFRDESTNENTAASLLLPVSL